jgi:nucleotide-binding universal stress UspA family protein
MPPWAIDCGVPVPSVFGGSQPNVDFRVPGRIAPAPTQRSVRVGVPPRAVAPRCAARLNRIVARRVQRAGGRVQLLYVIEPENRFWDGVRQAQLEEQTNKARALFRLFRRELKDQGFDGVIIEEVIREGKKAEEILKQIDEDEDVSVLGVEQRAIHLRGFIN